MRKYLLFALLLISMVSSSQSVLRARQYTFANSLGFVPVSKDSSGYAVLYHLSVQDIVTLATSGGGTTLNGNGFVFATGSTISYVPTLDTSYFTNFFLKARASLATVAVTGNYNSLSNLPTIPAAQVNSDWNSVSGVSQILNKPALQTIINGTGFVKASGTTLSYDNSTYLASVDTPNISNFFTKVRASLQPIAYSTVPTGITKGNGSILSAAVSGTDYSAGTSGLATGILKNTNGTGAFSIAVAGDFPTLNQNTTGTSANITGVLNASSMPALTGDVTNTQGSLATTIPGKKWNSLSANATTTAATNTNTNLSFSIAANEVWVVMFDFTAQCSSTGGVKIQISAPTSATIEGWYLSSGATITTPVYNRITAINTLTATITHTVATTPGPDRVWIRVKNSTNAGTIALGFASGTSTQTTTIFAGATMIAFKVTEL
jgi:hypothetical protein